MVHINDQTITDPSDLDAFAVDNIDLFHAVATGLAWGTDEPIAPFGGINLSGNGSE